MNVSSETTESTDSDWQGKLLPFMTRAIAVMGLLFFASSSVQLHMMYVELKLDRSPTLVVSNEGRGSKVQSEESRRWDGLVALEYETIVRENQIVNAVILRQTSLLHLGFLTGMALCFIGAVFVLGRLREVASSLGGEAQTLKFALNTSSPGIILSVLGSGLMLATLYHKYQFNLPAKAVYLAPTQYSIDKARDPSLDQRQADEGTTKLPAQQASAGPGDQRAPQPDDEAGDLSDDEVGDMPAPQPDASPRAPR